MPARMDEIMRIAANLRIPVVEESLPNLLDLDTRDDLAEPGATSEFCRSTETRSSPPQAAEPSLK
jgi:hypothetical protein